jgi:hypothetical protein
MKVTRKYATRPGHVVNESLYPSVSFIDDLLEISETTASEIDGILKRGGDYAIVVVDDDIDVAANTSSSSRPSVPWSRFLGDDGFIATLLTALQGNVSKQGTKFFNG